MGKIQVIFVNLQHPAIYSTRNTVNQSVHLPINCRCSMEVALKELEKKRLEYEKSPEKHPLYPEEWKIFWNRRYKELQAGLHHTFFPHHISCDRTK